MAIKRPNQVWCIYIMHIPVQHGFLYLVAIMDWATRRVRAWRLPNTMDGRGRYLNNIFIERLWRSLKYEAVYLHELMGGFVAERVIGEWINYYDTERRHSSLGDKTLAEAYRDNRSVDMMDKADALTTYPQAQQQQDDIDLYMKKNWAA